MRHSKSFLFSIVFHWPQIVISLSRPWVGPSGYYSSKKEVCNATVGPVDNGHPPNVLNF